MSTGDVSAPCGRTGSRRLDVSPLHPTSGAPKCTREGWEGWDEYAPFYDWENAQTLGRRDIPFWRRIGLATAGRLLELGCGTGRISVPLARAGVKIVGIDRSEPMLARAAARGRRTRRGELVELVRGDIRALPFRSGEFETVVAPYGILQSLLSDRDLAATLQSVARVLVQGGRFGIDLVPDVPNWHEYRNRVQLHGRTGGGRRLTLIESVRQDPQRRRTTFEQRYLERRGGRTAEHRFELTFRTLSVRQMTSRLARAGFRVDAVLGDYRGRPWDERADIWIILAHRE
jgi:ubiquinone/menaquinone biosynthesis C-methylase UbiE